MLNEPEPSIYDAVLEENYQCLTDFHREIIAVHLRYMPEERVTKDNLFHRNPVFMHTGISLSGNQFLFESELDATEQVVTEKNSPQWYQQGWDNEEPHHDAMRFFCYLGIDLIPKHFQKYFEILAKMRLAYDYSVAHGIALFLPRIYCRIQKHGETVGILTEDVTSAQRRNVCPEISEDLHECDEAIALRELFYGDLERSFFKIRPLAFDPRVPSLYALVDVDHISVSGDENHKRYISLRHWYEQRDYFVVDLGDY